ncbi:protein kinase domain-containing protein [Caenimonas koreensis]|uniref:trifunctional serine/threonine-protein kinase/ATP-binding protein/sensor histidine kinase n=1 Tax=Caenimonas koreensis TaxID=367474 RepID=UPI0037831AF7
MQHARNDDSDDVIYVSATTRVYRLQAAAQAGTVVCKEFLGPDAARRLGTERELLARLAGIDGVVQLCARQDQPHVLALHDGDARPVTDLLRSGAMALPMVLSVARQLARILGNVHRAGVIHRDIHPANILVDPDGRALLIDFDLAVVARSHDQAIHDGQMVGTLGYAAPEQTGRTGRVVDSRADLYALGVTLYEMVTGRPPFQQADALALIHDHLVRAPVAPGDIDQAVPPALSAIILRLLEKAPERRYQSAEGLLHDLVALPMTGGPAPSPIELGERDFAVRLAAPNQLVGRAGEAAVLRSALADALHTTRRTVLVCGAAGVGKSALVAQLQPVVAAAGGWIAHGKFDQLLKETASVGGAMQAMRSIGRLLLAQPDAALAQHRARILAALGSRASLLTRIFPEFALLLGPQPSAPEGDPRHMEVQMQQAVVDLIGAVASPSRPLVIVLDDLQWAGAQSLRIFERLMSDTSLRGVLLVGTYRNDEFDASQVLQAMLARWIEPPQRAVQVELANLDGTDLASLIGDMLRLPAARVQGLASAVAALTDGNPFHTVEMINALRNEGLLSLGEQGWRWDEAAIRHFVGGSNVMDLVRARIAALPAASRELLETMSCLTFAVDYRLLGAAAGLAAPELEAHLRPCIEDGLIVAQQRGGQEGLRMRHERVQQATLAAMSEQARSQRRLAMARRLAPEPEFLAEAAQLYQACLPLLQARDAQLQDGEREIHRAAQLLHSLAQTLAASAAHQLAHRYLVSAAALLDGMGEPAATPLRRLIDAELHCALYTLGRADEADPLYEKMQAQMQHPQELVEPACLQMRSLDMRGRMAEAMQIGLRLLAQLGMHVRLDQSEAQIEQRLDALDPWVAHDSKIDPASRGQIRDARLMAVAKLLGRTAGSAYLSSDLKSFVVLLLESQRLWEEHGPCAELIACMGHMNAMLIGRRQDFRTGYRIARHVVNVGEALGMLAQTAEARYRFAGHACGWFEPLESAFEHARRACEELQARGDLSFACYGHTYAYGLLLDIAPTIDVHEAEIEAGLALCQRAGNAHAAAMHTCEQQFLRALRGLTRAPDSFDDEHFAEHEFMARVRHLPYVDFDYFRALQALIWTDARALAHHAPGLLRRVQGVAAGFFRVPHIQLFAALAQAWQLQAGSVPASECPQAFAQLEACRDWLAARAGDQPYNYLHLLRLVQAEQAWAQGNLWRAAAAFDSAVQESAVRERAWHRGLIAERAGVFHCARGMLASGASLIRQSRDCYAAWGAAAKVAQLEQTYAFLRDGRAGPAAAVQRPPQQSGPGSHAATRDVLDLVGVLRASQALSSETTLELLTARVTDVLAALSGATKVLMLTVIDGQWWMPPHEAGLTSLPVQEAAAQGLLPVSAFAYAERTDEALVIDDVRSDARFAGDPYFAQVPVCSLLVVPIAGQGGTRAVLVLENRLGRAAFNAQRLDAVRLIAGQLAVSLANAQLYENLERRVQARTVELQQMQARLVAAARSAGRAEIANNVLHNVGNVLNSVNVSASVVRRTVDASSIERLTRGVALMNELATQVPDFMGSDPRGKTLQTYFNDLVGVLAAERQTALEDIDRLSRSIEHIIYVVATQQSHAGPSSVLESSRPDSLMDEALLLAADAVKRSGAIVVRRYTAVPTLSLDRQRLLEILVNLIVNAAQALHGTPPPDRRLTVGTDVIEVPLAEGGKKLRLTVADQGEGIAMENVSRIFAHGFTTRQTGHGFGLHSSALAAMEMGGRITVHSDGPGRGAQFIVEIPLRPAG